MEVVLAILFLVVVIALTIKKVQEHNEENGLGWLYFIGSREGPIKVGMTRDHPQDRLKALQTGHPNRLQLFYAMRTHDPEGAEAIAHEWLEEDRVGGEWFGREAALSLMHELKGE